VRRPARGRKAGAWPRPAGASRRGGPQDVEGGTIDTLQKGRFRMAMRSPALHILHMNNLAPDFLPPATGMQSRIGRRPGFCPASGGGEEVPEWTDVVNRIARELSDAIAAARCRGCQGSKRAASGRGAAGFRDESHPGGGDRLREPRAARRAWPRSAPRRKRRASSAGTSR